MTVWADMTDDTLRRIWEASIPALNQASSFYGIVPGSGQWASIADGQQAMLEMNRRLNPVPDPIPAGSDGSDGA